MTLGSSIDLLIALIKSMAVVVVLAYLLSRTRFYRDISDRQGTWQGTVLLILIFGAFSVWGTLAGVEMLGGIANTRNLGPVLGGLLGGPVVGIAVGLIGGIQRLAMGGMAAVPTALATMLAGVLGGVAWWVLKGRIPRVWVAMLLGVAAECINAALTLALAKPFAAAADLVVNVIPAMIIVNALGMGAFVFIVRNEREERLQRQQNDRMAGELKVARDIQLGIVPTVCPMVPGRHDFEMHASMDPAREVGGDLYDFFLMPDGRLAFSIGDVSGKGVPAALFMAVTITLLRAVGDRYTDPDEIITRVNQPLCRDNDSCMFVTLFFAVYDPTSGALEYTCGGHPPGYVLRAGAAPEPLPRTAGAGLGVSDEILFESAATTLQPGDRLFLYTDGVTEAHDGRGELFGDARLADALTAAGDAGPEELTANVKCAVDAFAAGAEQYDDITMLALQRLPAAGA